jgi:hypothetical protein
MFIVGVVVGPALAILIADVLLKPGQMNTRWVWLGVAAIMLVIIVMPFFATELKVGLIFGLPLGLLLALSPMALQTVERTTEPSSRP